jgi:hypothetical protein
MTEDEALSSINPRFLFTFVKGKAQKSNASDPLLDVD